VTGARRLSQAIAEGDGISVLVEVSDADGARAAEQQGAEGLVVRSLVEGVREATDLPLLAFELEHAGGADALVVDVGALGDRLTQVIDEVHGLGLECVLRVRDEEELEEVLELFDPEILLLSAEEADDGQHHLDRLLELLPDIPAGKLAIAELASANRDEVVELERAGVDAVIVAGHDVGPLVGDALPEV
jgi:indole-3-glycerol phosphate synthase